MRFELPWSQQEFWTSDRDDVAVNPGFNGCSTLPLSDHRLFDMGPRWLAGYN